ncbi:MAG: hypothetical protein H6Q73_3299 [Firmicutes bacterium]|nr:hypothetical protein [Bacillota bacterium]
MAGPGEVKAGTLIYTIDDPHIRMLLVFWLGAH